MDCIMRKTKARVTYRTTRFVGADPIRTTPKGVSAKKGSPRPRALGTCKKSRADKSAPRVQSTGEVKSKVGSASLYVRSRSRTSGEIWDEGTLELNPGKIRNV